MPADPAAIGAGVGLLVLVLTVPELFFRPRRELARVVALLQGAGSEQPAGRAAGTIRPRRALLLLRLARPAGRLLASAVGARYRGRLAEQLAAARLDGVCGVEDVLGAKVLCALATGGYFALLWAVSRSPLLAAAAPLMIVLGLHVPDQWLAARLRRRRQQVERELPAAIHALAVGVEAGLSLGGAMEEAARRPGSVLAEEFRRAVEEVRLGRTQREALEAMAARCQVPELTRFVSTLVQHFEKGSAELTRLLREQAREAWEQRKRRAEELAQQASIKLFLPLLALVFPALLIFLFLPALLTLVGFFLNRPFQAG